MEPEKRLNYITLGVGSLNLTTSILCFISVMLGFL